MRLHSQLEADCHVPGDRRSGTLALHRDSAVAGFTLVPAGNVHEPLDWPPEVLFEPRAPGNTVRGTPRRVASSSFRDTP